MKRLVWAFAMLLGTATVTSAREVWVVQFRTQFPDVSPPPCQSILRWYSRLLLSNSTDLPLSVSILGVSNGPLRSDASGLTVPPHQTVSVLGTLQIAPPHWAPDFPETATVVWATKLDVPTGVYVSDRGEIFLNEMTGSNPGPPCNLRGQGIAALPFRVVDQLTPAGVSQYHLGTDIGDAANAPFYDARVNVGIFNASQQQATALVEVRCSQSSSVLGGPDPLVTRTTVVVPPNSIIQQTVLNSTRLTPCPAPGSVNPYHVIVTSDQPGFSYAAALSNEVLLKFPGFSPATN